MTWCFHGGVSVVLHDIWGLVTFLDRLHQPVYELSEEGGFFRLCLYSSSENRRRCSRSEFEVSRGMTGSRR